MILSALLARPEMTVTEVALAVGHEMPSAFTASFRKLTGMTPGLYRQRL